MPSVQASTQASKKVRTFAMPCAETIVRHPSPFTVLPPAIATTPFEHPVIVARCRRDEPTALGLNWLKSERTDHVGREVSATISKLSFNVTTYYVQDFWPRTVDLVDTNNGPQRPLVVERSGNVDV